MRSRSKSEEINDDCSYYDDSKEITLLFNILNFVLYKDSKCFEKIYKTLTQEVNLFKKPETYNPFNIKSSIHSEIKEELTDFSSFYSPNNLFYIINEK